MKELKTPSEKLAWLRANVDPDLPDIYNQPGFTPNGCGPDTWKFLGLKIDGNQEYSFLGMRFRLNVPNKLIGLPRLNVAGDLHDWRYYCGGNEVDRLRADEELRATMQKLVTTHWWNPFSWLDRARMTVLSNAFYIAVREFGTSYFHYAKAKR